SDNGIVNAAQAPRTLGSANAEPAVTLADTPATSNVVGAATLFFASSHAVTRNVTRTSVGTAERTVSLCMGASRASTRRKESAIAAALSLNRLCTQCRFQNRSFD